MPSSPAVDDRESRPADSTAAHGGQHSSRAAKGDHSGPQWTAQPVKPWRSIAHSHGKEAKDITERARVCSRVGEGE